MIPSYNILRTESLYTDYSKFRLVPFSSSLSQWITREKVRMFRVITSTFLISICFHAVVLSLWIDRIYPFVTLTFIVMNVDSKLIIE